MPFNHSPLSYADCRGALDKALLSERGVKISLPTPGNAQRLIHRLHACRKMDRKMSQEVLDKDDPMWGLSAYDRLIIKRQENVVIIEHVTEDTLKVEDL